MKNYLLDIVKNLTTHGFQAIRIIGTDDETTITARQEENAVIVRGVTKKSVPEFEGTLGLGNLEMLTGLIGVPAFTNKEAKISVKRTKRNDSIIPEEIVFEAPGQSKATYRLLAPTAIAKQVNFDNLTKIEWDVTFVPSKQKVAEFAQLAAIYSSVENKFSAKTEDGHIKLFIGNEESATHRASTVFADVSKGTLKLGHAWSINNFLNVLKLMNNGDCTVHISNRGFIKVDIETPFVKYEFVLSGQN